MLRIRRIDIRYFSACMRHMTAWMSLERYDKKSKVHHLGHAIACLLILIWEDVNGS